MNHRARANQQIRQRLTHCRQRVQCPRRAQCHFQHTNPARVQRTRQIDRQADVFDYQHRQYRACLLQHCIHRQAHALLPTFKVQSLFSFFKQAAGTLLSRTD